MKGKILDFQVQSSSGAISGDDGNRYNFQASEWKENNIPERGMSVDFDIKDGQATAIYLSIEETKPTQKGKKEKNRITAGILALLIGHFGVHKFYLGHKGTGVLFLVSFWGGMALFFIPTLIIAVISVIEGILYLCKSDEEFQQIYVIEKKRMF